MSMYNLLSSGEHLSLILTGAEDQLLYGSDGNRVWRVPMTVISGCWPARMVAD